eukprot:GHVS01035515.1.p1 GENE.GHVS01035515.1~~GHVS01035515.1.p1  ORF type:complete len:163 (+),score=14.83 GHVS01035515.1:45-533(+)
MRLACSFSYAFLLLCCWGTVGGKCAKELFGVLRKPAQIIEWGRLRTPTFCKHQRSLPSQQHVGVVDSAECINLAGPQWTSARRPFINIKRPFLFRLIFPNTQVSSIVCASFVQHTSLLSPCSRVLLLGRFLFDVGHRRMACGQPSLQGSRSGGRELAAYGLF